MTIRLRKRGAGMEVVRTECLSGPSLAVVVKTVKRDQPFWWVGEFTTHFRTYLGSTILVGIGHFRLPIGLNRMVTGGTIWVLTHGRVRLNGPLVMSWTGVLRQDSESIYNHLAVAQTHVPKWHPWQMEPRL